MRTLADIRIQVEVPEDPGMALDLAQQVLSEIAYLGVDLRCLPEAYTSVDFNDPDSGEFDASEYAFFMLCNRHLSETAENQITEVDYDIVDLP